MPNRIIKESVCSSENINSLSLFEEVFFYRLMVNCDDFGRMDGREAILKARLFPLKEVTNDDIRSALLALINANLIVLYKVEGKTYIQLKTWDNHQRIRSKRSKYPPLLEAQSDLTADCGHMTSNCARNPIQSESESESESECERAYLQLRDNKKYKITDKKMLELMTRYKDVDVHYEILRMRDWLLENPAKRKWEQGIDKFIDNWLQNAKRGTKFSNYEQMGDYDIDLIEKCALEKRLKKVIKS